MRQNLELALGQIFGHEAGFSNRSTAADPGGATMYGVTQATLSGYRGYPVTVDDVRRLTKDEAREIFISQYAAPIRFDDLPSGLDYAALDFAVNSGPAQAVRTLQGVLGVDQDGHLGLKTLAAIKTANLDKLILDYCDARLAFMRKLKNWPQNARGWTIRVTGEDPKRQWAKTPGVAGKALSLARGARTVSANSANVSHEGADPKDVRLTKTTTGKGVVSSAVGLISTGAADLKAPLEPIVGQSHYIDMIFTGLTVAGALALVVGVALTLTGKLRNIGAGVPA